jgi:hypothetical protein
MPTSNDAPGARDSADAIRAAVTRLSRLDGHGAAVIERAAILAEGTPSAAIEAWIIEHGGRPDTGAPDSAAPERFGLSREARPISGTRAPRRYVLAATALPTSA